VPTEIGYQNILRPDKNLLGKWCISPRRREYEDYPLVYWTVSRIAEFAARSERGRTLSQGPALSRGAIIEGLREEWSIHSNPFRRIFIGLLEDAETAHLLNTTDRRSLPGFDPKKVLVGAAEVVDWVHRMKRRGVGVRALELTGQS
jgi:hypothetical protein